MSPPAWFNHPVGVSRIAAINKNNKTKERKIKREVKNMILKELQGDMKVVYFNVATANVTSTGTLTFFNWPSQGLGTSQRVGDRIKLVRAELIYSIYGNSSDILNKVRIVWFQSMIPSSSFSSTNLFDTGPSTVIDVDSHYSFQNRKTFKVMCDKLEAINYNGDSGAKFYKQTITIPFKDIMCFYGTQNSPEGQIGVWFQSDSGLTPYPVTTMSLKLLYYSG